MKNFTPLLATLALALCGNVATSSPVPLSETPELQAAFKAMRALETKIEVGMSLTDYRREVADMAVEIAPLDEVLQARHADSLRSQLSIVRQRYVLASQLWNACIQDRDNCLRQKVIDINRPRADGGVLEPKDGKQSFVFLERLMNAMWVDAKTKSQALRADIANGAT